MQKGARTQVQSIRTMSNDRLLKTLPFAFRLEDARKNSAIYIVDDKLRPEQRLKVWLENTAGESLYFKPLESDKPLTADNCHFELCFRRGVLADASLGRSQNKLLRDLTMETLASRANTKQAFRTGSWIISPPQDDPQLPYLSFFLGRVGKETAAEFAAGSRLSFTLTNISARPGHGTRATHVELIPRNVFSQPDLATESRLRYAREQTLQVINHRGQEFIPLHTTFIGGNVVLNDGRDHGAGYSLHLRITNISRHDLISFTPDSRIIFEFGHGDDDNKEALGIPGNVSKIQFFVGTDRIEPPDGIDMARYPQWLFGRENNLAGYSIEPHENLDFEIKLDEFATVAPAGLTLLKIRYENVPGYWDGMLHAVVEKRPLLIKKVVGRETVHLDSGSREVYFSNNVGISKNDPTEALDVVGNIVGSGNLTIGNNKELFFPDNGQIRSRDNNHRILFRRSEDTMEFREYGKIVFSSGATSGAATNKMTILANGKVGLGVTTPRNLLDLGTGHGKKLAVYQNASGSDFYGLGISSGTLEVHAGSSANGSPKMVVKSNGRVGIGRPVPGSKLDVNGKVKATTLDVGGKVIAGSLEVSGYSKITVARAVCLELANNSDWQSGQSHPSLRITNNGNGYALLINKGSTRKPGNKEWDNPSDLRLKEDISVYAEGLAELNQLRPVWYRYNGKDNIPKDRYVGIIAQELQKIAPHMITEYRGEDGEEYLMTNTSPLTYMLVNAVQELSRRVEELEKTVKNLKKSADA